MAPHSYKSQSSGTPLGCHGMGDLHHECTADRFRANVSCFHVNMDKDFWGMFPSAPMDESVDESMPRKIKSALKAKLVKLLRSTVDGNIEKEEHL